MAIAGSALWVPAQNDEELDSPLRLPCNLTIQSVQDRSTYAEKSQQGGISLSIPIYGAGAFSASASVGSTNINSNYLSVMDTSGIKAGAAAQGSSCGSAAVGAMTSTVLNNLLGDPSGLSNEQKLARSNIVTSLVAGVTSQSSQASAAVNAAAIETDNNALSLRGSSRLMTTLRDCSFTGKACDTNALKAEMQRDTQKQNQRIQAACTGASANLSLCTALSNNANQVASDLFNASIYADTPDKQKLIADLVQQQLADTEALRKQLASNTQNASVSQLLQAGIVDSISMLSMASLKVKGGGRG